MLYRKEEAEQRAKQMMRAYESLVEDFNKWMRPEDPVSVKVYPKQFPMGWGLLSKVYFGETLVKEYDFAELAYLDLNELVIGAMVEHFRRKHKKSMQALLSLHQTERMAKTNLEAVRHLDAEDLAMCLMCPYDHLGNEEKSKICSKVESCKQCSFDWLLQTYDEKHHWFDNKEG